MKTMEQSNERLQDQWPEQLTWLPQDTKKEISNSVPDGPNQIIQGMTSYKEEITAKEQQCYQINESIMIIYPGAPHLNPNNSLINYSQYEERFKKMDESIRNMKDVNASRKELEARELSLIPDLVIPHEFKMPDFEKYDGTTVVWYNQLTQEQIKRWVDLANAFLGQYRYVKGLTPTRMDLRGLRIKANEGFKKYSLRWRGVEEQVQPPMLEKEILHMFRDSFLAPFFELMHANPTKEFENLVISGESIENVVNEGNSNVTSKSPTVQKAKADNVNECPIQSPRNCKRKRASICSDRPKKVMRSRKTLEVFQTSISDLYPHLVKGRYITPKPTKVPPNPFAHCYDQNSFCNFHLGVKGHSTENYWQLLK
ncbi:hypothetical protein F3Y22_tig00116962pilonHSYRG00155 [Hibiscus syriacus]|uniref:Retrotransposon gag domain-containing protein n=1 Tax=Hibiscus syriacus TaxID=106335 RepID=A0A6A2XSW4_HIBSY|nr:hypothetical protein F3Y22_tig00116962pilonHSYRG00155 [Hibiscus syriacus]